MTTSVLDRLLSDDFQASAAGLSTAETLRLFFTWKAEVRQVAEAMRDGRVTEGTVGELVKRLTEDLHKGRLFRHDLVLAALAVALEDHATPFAEKYLHDLASLRLAEMPRSIRVAREVLKHRTLIAKNQSRVEYGPRLVEGVFQETALAKRYPGRVANQVTKIACGS